MSELTKYQDQFVSYVKDLQDLITAEMKAIDPGLKLTEDNWQRKDFVGNDGGGGRTRAFSGKVFENAGVNTSLVFGKVDPKFAKSIGGNNDEMWATGISLIIHPYGPKIPTVHANFRMIKAGDRHWFGGGADLTPFYPHEEDFEYFHKVWQDALKDYGLYDDMKKQCDQYFTNHHRGSEMRGVGGIFFDHFNTGNVKNDFEMVRSLGDRFISSYFPIVKKRLNEKWTSEDEDFQLHRRGRYVEFNLIHDRGTHFGLKSGGRIESILISLPHRCKFSYNYKPAPGSVHEKMMDYYKRPF